MTHHNTNTNSFTLEALLAADAARTPAEQERDLAHADAAALGLHAQELADRHLARGDLTSARRWHQVAVHYDVPGAADALNDVETLIEVTVNVPTTIDSDEHRDSSAAVPANTVTTSAAQVTVLDDLADAALLVRQAHAYAAQLDDRSRAILDDARADADRIVMSARHEADRITAAGTADARSSWLADVEDLAVPLDASAHSAVQGHRRLLRLVNRLSHDSLVEDDLGFDRPGGAAAVFYDNIAQISAQFLRLPHLPQAGLHELLSSHDIDGDSACRLRLHNLSQLRIIVTSWNREHADPDRSLTACNRLLVAPSASSDRLSLHAYHGTRLVPPTSSVTPLSPMPIGEQLVSRQERDLQAEIHERYGPATLAALDLKITRSIAERGMAHTADLIDHATRLAEGNDTDFQHILEIALQVRTNATVR